MAASEMAASLSFAVELGVLKRTTKSSTSSGRCPVLSLSLSDRWLSSLLVFCSRQPVCDDTSNAAVQYRSHSILFDPASRFVSKHLFAKKVSEFTSFEWFHDDLIGFQKDGGHGALHVGIATDKQRKSIRRGMAHRGYDGKAIAGILHMQVRDKNIEGLRRKQLQSSRHVDRSGYVKSLMSEGRSHHVTNGVVIVHEQDFMPGGSFGRIVLGNVTMDWSVRVMAALPPSRVMKVLLIAS